ncbi:hypothetical protein [Geobacillus phage TP-84]|uniref:Uncharacterized protein n=1 Tax=Geobacillus phage TP-84 TaxID=1965361 RepID=A0A1U9WQQ1_9CAUD|nr:hypothetical protein MUK65_gp71 [Geobacillus phage TP-84]AQY55089.1 hypothetical protein [Geobacillus phage TP-84]
MAIKSREAYMIMRNPETHMEIKIDLTKENAGDLAIKAHEKGFVPMDHELTRNQYHKQFKSLSKAVNPKPRKRKGSRKNGKK